MAADRNFVRVKEAFAVPASQTVESAACQTAEECAVGRYAVGEVGFAYLEAAVYALKIAGSPAWLDSGYAAEASVERLFVFSPAGAAATYPTQTAVAFCVPGAD